ncbi:efflux RND transporter periplasmic adaptor subunit [uncultured Ruegeria sp.]|uniref:efflux RND transporter periplasmic adaptor subunit n=1 Tax=uncultured Ruegeria sp. TaxID=259304 RepID=UPI002621AE97|nr:efflux RND transporter periplasmic adaptor subunit [uncultured Ruegeria sp.]
MNLRPLLFLPPLAIGIGGYMWLTAPNPSEQVTPPETVTVVRTLTISPSQAVPSASGYGRVVAEDSWLAISQVQGRAVYVDDELTVGSVLSEGTEIVRIDPRDYEIALTRATASRDSAQAALDELDASEINTKDTIELETRIKEVRRAELERQETLLERGSVAQAVVDTAIRDLLSQEKMVLSLENSLRLLPAQRASLQATIDTRIVEIEEAERALANTSIKTPLTGRVTAETVSPGQFVRVGDTLATIESTKASEVTAEFQTRVLGNLFTEINGVRPLDAVPNLDIEDAFDLLKRFDLQAQVTMSAGGQSYVWPAELVRFDGSVDPTTDTVGLVVRIENPSIPDPARRGPPLTNGMFVEVRLFTPDPIEALRIPRAAIHSDGRDRFVYVVDGQSRLARQSIDIGSVQADQVVVLEGLSDGDQLVLSDPRPAVIGMLLEPLETDLDQGS